MSNASSAHGHTNRLIHETSPYLLQHAHNPVDWYAWGPEAFERARREDKPIFLSVGYSTCYWCHVMERQCFENEWIAQLMNERFVSIKVDREERPDVDQLYMLAVQIMTRQGGWPMSVFLTSDLKPFYGGTYFPPQDMPGRAGFGTLLKSISEAYRDRRQEVDRSAEELVKMMGQFSQPRGPEGAIDVDADWVAQLVAQSIADYDATNGGFSQAPKFPQETLLEMLLRAVDDGAEEQGGARPAITNPDSRKLILGMIRQTLDAMADGGIRDHLGGGFHRYSTDAQWLVPHFEIMLYDNAMLAVCYAQAHRMTGEARYAKIARGILDFVLREMTSPEGAFYTAFDAEVDAMEGGPYLWTADEVTEALLYANVGGFATEDIDLFLRAYGLDAGPNFADPHHGTGRPDKNVLSLPVPLAKLAEQMKTTEEELDARLAPMREALLAARKKRKQPMLDTKILTSWNALMIRAMAVCGSVLNEPKYVEAGARAARYLLDNHRLGDGTILRRNAARKVEAPPKGSANEGSSTVEEDDILKGVLSILGTTATDQSAIRNSQSEISALGTQPSALPSIPGFLDDYAFLADALVALFDATGQKDWRNHALRTVEVMKDKFLDAESGGFFFTPKDAFELPVRQKSAHDSPLPSGNAVAARALLRLGDVEEARRTIAIFAQSMQDQAQGMPSMVQAAMEYLAGHEPFSVVGKPQPEGRPESIEEIVKSVLKMTPSWQSPTELLFEVEIATPFHLNAHDAANGLIGTSLSLSLPQGVTAAIDYPPGEERKFAFADQPLRVYEGRMRILARLSGPVPEGAKLRASLAFQACTEDACLPPARAEMEIGYSSESL